MKKNSGVLVAGLALFSMFFGAGDLIWPLILGGASGDKNLPAMLGLLVTGVSLPLLGLMAMMLFRGDYRAFFGQTGRRTGFILILIIQAILGPIGSIPRLITLSYATLQPYMPAAITLPIFSVLSAILVLFFTIKRKKVVEILGIVLCPFLLLSLGGILVVGFFSNPPPQEVVALSTKQAFFNGLNVGYNTLDLIASFIFAPLVMTYFTRKDEIDTPENRKQTFVKMIKACGITAILLSGMYIGLTYIASHYISVLPEGHPPEARLAEISIYLLGPYGALFSCVAVAMSCLTTAIPISVISAEFIHQDLFKGRGGILIPCCISLGIAMVLANIGFMGIAALLSPILQILCPGLIILSILNILHKLYEMRPRRIPVYAAFALSTIGYFIR